MSKEIATVDAQIVTPMALLARAQESHASIEQMQQLLDLQLRWEANEARKAFNQALAAFKAEGVKITKGKHVQFTTSKGVTQYDHATLGNVVERITPALSKYGLSHTWEVTQDQFGIEVTCRLAHVQGHSETVKIKAEADDSGGKNKIQQIGSTITYLQRYTLLSITGLSTHDQDDDGRKAEVSIPVITEEQAHNLLALIDEVKADEKAFCTYFKAPSVEGLAAKNYAAAVAMLEKKRGAQ